MSALIDSCCLNSVLNPQSEDHFQFRPLLEWIAFGKGRMVYGGSKYKKELAKVVRSLPLLVELERARKVVRLSDLAVDRVAVEVKGRIADPKFND